MLSRYGHLRSQYVADIHRLTIIVDGEQNMSTAPKASIEEKLKALKKQRTDIEKLIQQELKLQASKIEKSIEAYRAYIQLSNYVDLIAR